MSSGKGIGKENQRYSEEEMRPYSQNFCTRVVITRWYWQKFAFKAQRNV